MATQVGNVVFAISADLKNLQGQLRTMEGQFQSSFGKIEGVISKANSVLGLFGVGLSAGALIGFGKTIIDVADNVSDLADQTGLSIDLLGGLQSAAKRNGVSINEMADNILRAQKALGQANEDGKGAAAALQKLGLNIEVVRNLSPDELFETLAQKLATIENRNDRAAIATEFFGKAGAKTNAAILQWVDEGMTKLDASTALAYKNLGALKDQFGAVTIAALNFGAVRFDELLHSINDVSKALSTTEGLARLAVKGPGEIFKIIAEGRAAREAEAQGRQIGQIGAAGGIAGLRAQGLGTFKGLATETKKSAAQKAAEQTATFLEGLERQITDIQSRAAEIRFGPEAGLTAKLDAQLEEFKRKLTEEKLPIPEGLDDFFTDLKTHIITASAEFEKLKLEMERVGAVGKAMSQDSAEWLNVDEDLDKAKEKTKGLREEFEKLKTQLAIESIDTSTPQGRQQQRALRLSEQARETARKIEEAGRAAGASQEAIAANVQLAWGNAFKEIQNSAEETTIFQERVFERMQDSISNMTKDLISGQINSWNEFGDRVLDIVQSITAEFVAMQLKIALFGEKYGSRTGGGAVGGILGAILRIFGFGGGAAQTYSTPIGGAFDYELLAGMYHRGGVVGQSGDRRAMPAAIFHDAPRYHRGGWLKPDEMPIIAQKGERILPRWDNGGTGYGYGAAGMAGNTKVIINNNTGQPVETERRRGIDGEELLIIVGKRMARDVQAGAPLSNAIADTYGLARAPINRG